VLVVDDDPGFRAVLRELLHARGYRVVGEAGDGDTAVAAAAALRPSAAVVDIHLPGPDGLAVARLLRGTADPPRVLLTSGEVDAVPDDVLARAGAAGFVTKTELAVTDLAPYLGS
jgi:DNA-binding NarL/FixJ family response regulator